MKEIDLAKPLIPWLIEQHWEVYQEVQFNYGSNIADIVAVRLGIMWIIECKVAYGLTVLEQAAKWPVHYRSIAIPRSKESRNYSIATDYYKVGVIEVNEWGIDEVEKAPLFIRGERKYWFQKNYLTSLLEIHKTFALAGSSSGAHYTPYKSTILEVRRIIASNPGCSIQFIYHEIGKMHYSSAESFKGSLLRALIYFEDNWCRVDTSTRPYKLFLKEVA